MITVTTEPALKRICAHMSGLLTVEEVEAFSRQEQDAVRSMGLGTGEFDLLVTTEGNQVQTQAVTDAIGKLILESPLKARKIATVRAGVLTRMQTRRMAKLRDNAEVFDTIEEAYRWLVD